MHINNARYTIVLRNGTIPLPPRLCQAIHVIDLNTALHATMLAAKGLQPRQHYCYSTTCNHHSRIYGPFGGSLHTTLHQRELVYLPCACMNAHGLSLIHISEPTRPY